MDKRGEEGREGEEMWQQKSVFLAVFWPDHVTSTQQT